MAERSLGVITPGSGGPVRATINETDPTAPLWCHRYRVTHWGNTNTGNGYAGCQNMIAAIGSGVFGVLSAPAQGLPSPALESMTTGELTLGPHNMAEVYIDADNATDSFLVSCVQG